MRRSKPLWIIPRDKGIRTSSVNMREEIIIEGPSVHDVGYRVYLLNYAAKLGILKFYAFNEEEEADGMKKVVIQVETSEEKLSKFLDFIHSSRPTKADVTRITRMPYEGEVYALNDFRQNLMLEQLSKGITAILEIRDSNAEIKKSNEEIKRSNEEIKRSNEEIKSNVEDLKDSNLRIETTQQKIYVRQETMIVKQEETLTEIKDLHHDISTTFDKRLKNIEEEQRGMKEAIRQLQATVR